MVCKGDVSVRSYLNMILYFCSICMHMLPLLSVKVILYELVCI